MSKRRFDLPAACAAACLATVSGLAFGAPAAAQEPVTITYWSQLDDPDQLAAVEKLVGEFEAAHPDVDVELTVLNRQDMDTQLRIVLGAGGGPDVANFDVGDAQLGAIARAGLVYDLTDAYAERGWDKRVFPWAVQTVTYDGRIYAVPIQQEAQGLWYNAALFREKGWEPPTSWASFTAAAEAAKEAGLIPIAHGTGELPTSSQLLANIVYGLIPADVVHDASTLAGSTTWRDDPRFLQAVETYMGWVEKGWLPENPNALMLDDYARLFLQGRAAMTDMGPWMASLARDSWKEGEVEPMFVPMPAEDTSFPLTNQGGPGSSILIRGSIEPEKVDAALDLVEYLFIRPESQQMWLHDIGMLPVTNEEIDPASFESPVLRSVWEAHNALGQQGGTSGQWLDQFVTPATGEIFNNGQQRLIAGVWSPQQFIDEISDATIEAREEAAANGG